MTEQVKDQEVDLEENQNLNVQEDIDAIFSGDDLSEEFKTKAKTIFEAAVMSKVQEEAIKLQEEFAQKLEEEKTTFAESLVSKIDEYLDYVVNEWVEDNKLAIQSGIKSEITEDFMVGLKNLFIEHYVDIPEDKVDIIEEFADRLNTVEAELDKAISENVSLREEVGIFKKELIKTEVSEGLTEVQIAKFDSLSDNIEFVSEEDYKEKLLLVKSKYFDAKPTEVPHLDESNDDSTLDESYSPVMDHYVKNISKTLKK